MTASLLLILTVGHSMNRAARIQNGRNKLVDTLSSGLALA
jgi:hypothetical protein